MYFPMKLEYTIYYLSPDPFCYIVSLLFLYAEYEDPVHQIYQLLPTWLLDEHFQLQLTNWEMQYKG